MATNSTPKNTNTPKTGANKHDDLELEVAPSPLSIEGLRSGVINHFMLKAVMFLLIAIFAIGFLFTSFNPTRGLNPDGAPAPGGGPENVALVGEDPIERAKFEQIVTRQDDMMAQYFGQKVGPLEYFGSRQRTLQSLISEAAQVQAGRAAGITVADAEIDAEINKQIDEQIKSGKAQDEAAFRRQVEAQFGSIEKYREDMQKEAAANRDQVERSLILKKLEKKIKDQNKVSEDDYKKSMTKLKIRQISIRPKDAPANDKTLTDKYKAEAKAKGEKLAAQLKKTPTPQAFAAIAKKESADFASKNKGGDLGWKLPAELPVSPDVRGQILKSSEKIIGPISDETSGEVSIWMVEGRALKLPKDYAKNKAKLLQDFEKTQEDEAWQKYQAALGKSAKSEISDPALQAYKIQSEQIPAAPAAGQNKLRQDALAKYQEALKYASGLEASAIRYQMALLYRETKQPKKAVEVLKTAADQTSDAPALDLEYARALREAGDKKTALSELQKVSKEMDTKEMDTAPPSAPSMFGGNPDDTLRFQIASEFAALGRVDLAKKESGKVKAPAGGGMPGGMMMPGGGAMTMPPQR